MYVPQEIHLPPPDVIIPLIADSTALGLLFMATSDSDHSGDSTPADNNAEQQGEDSKVHTPDQQIVTEWAKEAQNTGISREDAKALLGLAEEAGLKTRNDIGTDRWVNGDHIHVGSVNHIPVEE